MSKRKQDEPPLDSDPHGWLVVTLGKAEAHAVKVQRAVTALTGFEYIAGSDQGAGADRPFDHRAPDDSFRIDTKTQQQGVLDVKKEKPGKQFSAWTRSGKAFIPVQLVLDSLTNAWYVVPGIPIRTLGLDPLATAFDPAEPLAPFKIASGCLDDLLDKSAFLVLKQRVLSAFASLMAEKEAIMKAVDADYQVYIESTAGDMADNPDLMQAVARNAGAIRAIATNEDAMRALAESEEAMRVVAQSEEALRFIAENEDAMRTITANEQGLRSIATNPNAMRALSDDEDAMRAIADNDAAMLKLLGPEAFEVWKRTRPS